MPVSQQRFIDLIAEHTAFETYDFLPDGSIVSSDGTNEFTWQGGQWSWTNGADHHAPSMNEAEFIRLLANLSDLELEVSND